MKHRDLTKADIGWSYVAQFMQYGAGLLALPFLLHYLTSEQFGLWSAFLLISGLVQLLDFGLQPALIRHIAFSTADASQPDLQKRALGAYRTAARKLYKKLMWAVLITQIGMGTAYIYYIFPDLGVLEACAWLIFCGGSAVTFYCSYLGAVLQGLHHIAPAQKLNTIARFANLAFTVMGLVLGLQVFSCALGAAIGGLSIYALASRYLRLNVDGRNGPEDLPNKNDVREATQAIWSTARQLGSVSVATFLILRSSAFAASLYLPISLFAAYSLATQVFQAVVSLSRVRFNASIPMLSSAAHVQDINRFTHIYKAGTRQSWYLYAAVAAAICIFGPSFVHAINPRASTLSTLALGAMALLYMLEVIHGNAAIALTCFNRVPFVGAAWGTGIAIVALSFGVGVLFPGSVLALIIVQIVAQAAYNAWKWPLELRRQCSAPLTAV